MRPIATDEVAWSVCRSVTIVSTAKTAEPTEMPFGCGLGLAQATMHSMEEGADGPSRRGTLKGVSGPLQRIGLRVIG